MLVPSLAAMYVAPAATEMEQSMAVLLFDAANHYLGMGVGEHLGYFFTAIWTALASALIIKTNRIMAASGMLIALGVISGMFEPFGVPMTGKINSISYTLWAVWTLILGGLVLRGNPGWSRPLHSRPEAVERKAGSGHVEHDVSRPMIVWHLQ